MKRFHYSAFQSGKACEGIIRADTIDLAKEKLIREGYEEITLSLLSSVNFGFDQENPPEVDETASSST